MAEFPTLKGSCPWPWIGSYCILSCITCRSLPTGYIHTKFHWNQKNFLWMDGQADVQTRRSRPNNTVKSWTILVQERDDWSLDMWTILWCHFDKDILHSGTTKPNLSQSQGHTQGHRMKNMLKWSILPWVVVFIVNSVISLTLFLSFIEPRPSTAMRQPAISWSRLTFSPPWPSIFPTKFTYNASHLLHTLQNNTVNYLQVYSPNTEVLGIRCKTVTASWIVRFKNFIQNLHLQFHFNISLPDVPGFAGSPLEIFLHLYWKKISASE